MIAGIVGEEDVEIDGTVESVVVGFDEMDKSVGEFCVTAASLVADSWKLVVPFIDVVVVVVVKMVVFVF